MINKTIYVLLFVITFSIMHDMFISLLHPNNDTQTVQCEERKHMVENIVDIHEIHSMFHFLAIVSEKIIFFDTTFTSGIASRYTLLYSSLYKQKASKPPIA